VTAQSTPIAKVAKKSNRGSAPGERRGGRTAGVPNKATQSVREFARNYGPEAIRKAAEMAGLIKDKDGKSIGAADSEQVQMTALNTILDRAYGKAAQALTGEGGEGPVETHNVIEYRVVRSQG